jgi:hypothetical protein
MCILRENFGDKGTEGNHFPFSLPTLLFGWGTKLSVIANRIGWKEGWTALERSSLFPMVEWQAESYFRRRK